MLPEYQARFKENFVTLRNGVKVNVRPMSKNDADALGEFYESVPRQDFRFYCPYKLDRPTAAEHAALADSPIWVVLVIETPEKKIAGYAWYRMNKPEDKESVFGICIRPGWQDTGSGRAVMTRLLEVAREVGPPMMNLTVQLANPRAVALYQKMGFVIKREQMRGQVQEFPPEPEYFMEQPVRCV